MEQGLIVDTLSTFQKTCEHNKNGKCKELTAKYINEWNRRNGLKEGYIYGTFKEVNCNYNNCPRTDNQVFRLLINYDANVITDDINKAIKKGWKLQGTVNTLVVKDKTVFCQSLIK